MVGLNNKRHIILSNIYGNTNSNCMAIYKLLVPFTCDYFVDFENIEAYLIMKTGDDILKLKSNSQIHLKRNSIVYIKIISNTPNFDFVFNCYCNKSYVPYNIKVDNSWKNIEIVNNEVDSLKPALIEANKRKGGTYIYCNVPESMPNEAINSVICKQQKLTGKCFLTWEIQNKSDYDDIYLGYRLINKEDHDICVTVKHIGYQVDGSWLGECSWMDYYGITYNMDEMDSFNEEELKWCHDYLGFVRNYKPNSIKPTTYVIPKGKSLFIIGGTSKDNYRNINVNNTADIIVHKGHCANANMQFIIYNGKADGEFVAYNDINKVTSDNRVIQNFRGYYEGDDMGGRVGVGYHHGVIDINPIWTFNDKTPSCLLPVMYYPVYADTYNEKCKPGEKIPNQYPHEYIGNKWFTHLSSQMHHDYIGQDMVEHHTYMNKTNKKITLSVNRGNPAGLIWDYGNWMIEYQENLVFINQGDNKRTLKITIFNGGSLFYILKDENENIIKASVTFGGVNKNPIYECDIKPHSRLFISMQVVLPANDCGSIEHFAELI